MPGYLALLLLPLASLAFAAPDSLCGSNESPVFDCGVGNKRLSICAAGDLRSNTGTLQYRFGTRERIELRYPAPAATPSGHFLASHTSYSGGGEFRIRFRNGDYDYLVFDSTTRTGFGAAGNQPLFEAGVQVKRQGKLLATRRCSGARHLDSDLLAQLPEEEFDYDARP